MPAVLEAEVEQPITAAFIESLKASKESLTGRLRSLANLNPPKLGDGVRRSPEGKTGRPPGVKNAETVYRDALPKKARQWVASTAPAVLIDARKIALPIDSDTSGSVADAQPVLAFLAQHLTLIMAQPPSLLMAHSVAEPQVVTATPPSLSVSAGTGVGAVPPTPPLGTILPS